MLSRSVPIESPYATSY